MSHHLAFMRGDGLLDLRFVAAYLNAAADQTPAMAASISAKVRAAS